MPKVKMKIEKVLKRLDELNRDYLVGFEVALVYEGDKRIKLDVDFFFEQLDVINEDMAASEIIELAESYVGLHIFSETIEAASYKPKGKTYIV